VSAVRVAGRLLGKDDQVARAEQNGEIYVTAGEAARILRVSPKTVSRWADKGLITCMVTLGGHRRFLKRTVETIEREMYGAPSALESD
jgi:excisionase family DNA binding protein